MSFPIRNFPFAFRVLFEKKMNFFLVWNPVSLQRCGQPWCQMTVTTQEICFTNWLKYFVVTCQQMYLESGSNIRFTYFSDKYKRLDIQSTLQRFAFKVFALKANSTCIHNIQWTLLWYQLIVSKLNRSIYSAASHQSLVLSKVLSLYN